MILKDGSTKWFEMETRLIKEQGIISNLQVAASDITTRKQAQAELQRAHDLLEKRVIERTARLDDINKELIREIDERKQAEIQSQQAKEAAEAANQAKSDFLANMSHELRTPLNHIIGFTELVTDQVVGPLNATQEEYLNDVLGSSKHLLSLVNDILDLAKVESGKMELEVTEIYLRKILENSLSMVKEKALKHRIQLLTEMDGIPEVIQGDGRKLKQILYNLLSNAVKFTPDGGSVTLSARYLSFREGQWFSPDGQFVGLQLDRDDLVMKGKGLIDISVQDTGIGIKGEDLQRIFQPFEQADNSASRKYQGSGLGLSLVRRLVELHGGKIWAESEGEGKGSKFFLLMPV
jgi:signal transduction histidine kinase